MFLSICLFSPRTGFRNRSISRRFLLYSFSVLCGLLLGMWHASPFTRVGGFDFLSTIDVPCHIGRAYRFRPRNNIGSWGGTGEDERVLCLKLVDKGEKQWAGYWVWTGRAKDHRYQAEWRYWKGKGMSEEDGIWHGMGEIRTRWGRLVTQLENGTW